mmetsp:Transcript_24821/g.36416  ORF Transcript_24821/g.36416 Transcript_24821/m.36416 type:complete len:82 (+) Transcript_24821:106-351(+)
MPLTVKTLARTTFEVPDLTEETKIEDIKNLLMQKYNIGMDQMRLIYSGKQLENSMTVQEAGIYDTTKNVMISMVLSLRGGR